MRRAGICLLTIMMFVGRGDAQPAMTTPTPTPVPAKSSSTAVTLSTMVPLLTTGLGFALARGDGSAQGIGGGMVVAGLTVGPATGLWYAGHAGGVGIVSRGVLLLLGTSLLARHEDADYDDCLAGPGCDVDAEYDKYQREVWFLRGAMAATAAVYLTSFYYDARQAGRIVDRRNTERRLMVAPVVISTTTGRAPGVMLGARF